MEPYAGVIQGRIHAEVDTGVGVGVAAGVTACHALLGGVQFTQYFFDLTISVS